VWELAGEQAPEAGIDAAGSDISPIWNPEVYGTTMVVNGRTWPELAVEPRRYRFRLLDGSNGRFLILKLVSNPAATRPASPAVPFWQIGADGGFLPAPVEPKPPSTGQGSSSGTATSSSTRTTR
jgi:spore coat protein A